MFGSTEIYCRPEYSPIFYNRSNLPTLCVEMLVSGWQQLCVFTLCVGKEKTWTSFVVRLNIIVSSQRTFDESVRV